ncbi:hypothetical protein LCGC14_1423510 [marine sediment metagenome]|uniref:Uncharacterized protein n=1 Tax=marine sediment metagenome TaxID=412755 RepID=A0A0F9JR39_9ZZZZ
MAWVTDTIPFTPTGTLFPSTMEGRELYFIDRGTRFYLYNYSTQTWLQKANPSVDSGRLGGGIKRGGSVYWPGRTQIHIYNINGDSWSVSATAAIAALRCMCFEDDDTIWCYSQVAGPFDKVMKYVISTNTWTAGGNDSAYNISNNVLWKAGELYVGTNNGVRKYVTATEVYSSVDVADGRDFLVGHDPDFLNYIDGAGDYGYWKYSDASLNDDAVLADTITAGWERFANLSPSHLDVVAQADGTTTLAIMVGALVFPTDPLARVSGLIHRYDRLKGIYQLEMFIGDVSTAFSLLHEGRKGGTLDPATLLARMDEAERRLTETLRQAFEADKLRQRIPGPYDFF